MPPNGEKFTPRLLFKFFPNLFPNPDLPPKAKPSSEALANQWTWKQVVTDCAERFSNKIDQKKQDSNPVHGHPRVMTFPRIGSFSFSKPPGIASPTKEKEQVAASILSSCFDPLPCEKPKVKDSLKFSPFDFAKPLPRAPQKAPIELLADSPTKAKEAALLLSSFNSENPLPSEEPKSKDSLEPSSSEFSQPLPRAPRLKAFLALSSPARRSQRAALIPANEWTNFMNEIHIPPSPRIHFSTLLKAYLAANQDRDSAAFKTALYQSPITHGKGLEFIDLFKALSEKRRSQIQEFLSQAT